VFHEIRNVLGTVLSLAEQANEAVIVAHGSGDQVAMDSLPSQVKSALQHDA
jgi:hypothetical protein